jgi:hypothetical protein
LNEDDLKVIAESIGDAASTSFGLTAALAYTGALRPLHARNLLASFKPGSVETANRIARVVLARSIAMNKPRKIVKRSRR